MRPGHLFLLIIVLLLPGIGSADIIKGGSIQAVSDGINVTIRWATENESDLLGFEILRSSTYSGGYSTIGTIEPRGPSLYEFVDNSVFRRVTSIYYYRIKVKLTSGERYFPALNEAPITVNHSVSGIRRTWGSIKAMFR